MAKKKDEVPAGKFLSMVKVGAKGQIVIPKGARDLFGIKPGDTLLLMADTERGIALVSGDVFPQFDEMLAKGTRKA
jgi:AbrB family looped-hinge helix DNA binding protein